MRYFGLNAYCIMHGHDGGAACINEDGELLFYTLSERLSRKKYDNGLFGLNDILSSLKLKPVNKQDCIFTTSCDMLDYYQFEEVARNKGRSFHPISEYLSKYNINFVSHHLSHAVSSWMFGNMDEESLFITFDGMGANTDCRFVCHSLGFISPTNVVELDCFGCHDFFNVYSSGRRIEFELPNSHHHSVPGKLMGISGYVPQDKIKILERSKIDLKKLEQKCDQEGYTDEILIECASVYASFIHDVKIYIKKVLDKFPNHKNVVVGGGTFLALELNSFIKENGRNLIFAPCINDSGQSLGAAAYGYFLMTGKWPIQIKTPFIQFGEKEDRGLYMPAKEAARRLMDGRIIGLITGQAEVGPRALGNRSFLALPTVENAKKVSMEVKKREFFRPVAPVVTDRDFDKLFTGSQGRYMQFRNFCKEEAKKLTPGIVHNDNTSRAQVLKCQDNPWLYDVLTEIGKLTGVECLINTSLNAPGKPICNSLKDAKLEINHPSVDFVCF